MVKKYFVKKCKSMQLLKKVLYIIYMYIYISIGTFWLYYFWHYYFCFSFISTKCNSLQLQFRWLYSRAHKSSDSFFSKILEKLSIVQKKMIPHINGLHFSMRWSKKKFKMANLENSKWPPQKNLVFQLRQFSIFFHEISMVWSLG